MLNETESTKYEILEGDPNFEYYNSLGDTEDILHCKLYSEEKSKPCLKYS